MSYSTNCLNCKLRTVNNALGLCSKCAKEMVKDGGFSTIKMGRLYGLSKDQLKKLKRSEELIPVKLENGNWQFPLNAVEVYLTNNPQRLENRIQSTGVYQQIARETTTVESVLINYEVKENPKPKDHFADTSTQDVVLLSKQRICTLFNLSISQFDELLKNYEVYEFENGRNKQYNKLQIMDAINRSSLSNGKWSPFFTKCRECATITKDHYASGYCVDCYPNTLEYIVLREYLTGKTFADIGREKDISRERVRQIFEKAVLNEAENVSDKDSKNSKEEIESIREVIKEEARKNSFRRKYEENIRNSLTKINEILNSTTISTSKVLLGKINITPGASFIIDEDYPDISRRLFMNGNQWSTKYEKCVICGTTDNKHRSNGMCEQCYRKSDAFRATQMKWRRDNYEKFRASQKRYETEYYQRPEVKKRQKIKEHQKRFGSNIRRELALKEYGNACSICKISRADHLKKYAQDLSVIHINEDLTDNTSENLKPFCKSCSNKIKRVRTRGQV